MIRFLYNLLWPFGLIFFLPNYLLKMFRRGNYAPHFGERFGAYSGETRQRLTDGQPIWLHAVSIGEVNVALKLAEALRARDPNLRCVLTTTTTTAYPIACRRAPDWMTVLYTPLDFAPLMHRAMNAIRPGKIVLVEQEVWPNMLAQAHRRNVPVALVNARLSPRSERRFRRFGFVIAPLLRQVDLVCVQFPEDVERWIALGVARERIELTGSIKYDHGDDVPTGAAQREILHSLGVTDTAPVIVGGSTHRGEEAMAGELLRVVRATFPDAMLVIAPRHVERTATVRDELARQGWRVALRSDSPRPARADVLLIDATGELRAWYATATVVLVGKSFRARGGQNPVEALVAGKPVVFGRHMENFAALADALVRSDAAVQVETVLQLQHAVLDLLGDPARRAKLVANAVQVLQVHHGAAARTAALVDQLRPRR